MIEKETQITELYELKHRNDSTTNNGFDYENKLFSKIFSNLMFGNNTLSTFLSYLQQNTVWMIDSTLPLRNFWNFTINKYYNQHNN